MRKKYPPNFLAVSQELVGISKRILQHPVALLQKCVILCVLSCDQQICLRHVCCVRLSVRWSLTHTRRHT